MKKLKFITVLIVTLFVATKVYTNSHSSPLPPITPMQQQQLEEYSKEQNRIAELAKMQDPTVIRTEMKKVGKVISLQGKYKYFSQITNTDSIFHKFTLREITLDFVYEFNMGMDLQYIDITKIDNGVVYINIPKSQIKLQSITMCPESQIVTGKKMFLVSQFSPSDVQTIIEQSQQNVIDKISKDDKLVNTAKINMQDVVEGLVKRLGYKEVIFDQI